MRKSLFWARLLGIFTFIMSLGVMMNIKQYQAIMATMANPANLLSLGIFTLFLGIGIVVSHQVWRGWPIIITILGYWIVFKGIVLVFFPMWINTIFAMVQTMNITYTPFPALLISILLLYLGFWTKRKKA